MTAEAEPNPSDVPFKDPDVSQPLQLQSEAEASASTPADVVIAPAPDAAPISLHASSDPQEANEVDADLISSQLVEYLRQALDALRGLNLVGFRDLIQSFWWSLAPLCSAWRCLSPSMCCRLSLIHI